MPGSSGLHRREWTGEIACSAQASRNRPRLTIDGKYENYDHSLPQVEPFGGAAMDANKRPLSVTILAWVYIAVGTVGFVYHLNEFLAAKTFQSDIFLIEAVEIIAIVGGAFMLRGQNWARWVALAWIAFHVIVSAFHPAREFVIHLLFCAVIAWLLFRPDATRYFRGARVELT
jgi:hypothetical protein